MQLLPLLPLRDIVVFPGMVVPLFVGREKSVAALETAMAGDKDIFLLAQLDPGCDDPDGDDLYDVGVIATVLQLLKLPDGTVRVLVEARQRARLEDLRLETTGQGEMVVAGVEPIDPLTASGSEVEAMMRSVVETFAEYAKLNKKLFVVDRCAVLSNHGGLEEAALKHIGTVGLGCCIAQLIFDFVGTGLKLCNLSEDAAKCVDGVEIVLHGGLLLGLLT